MNVLDRFFHFYLQGNTDEGNDSLLINDYISDTVSEILLWYFRKKNACKDPTTIITIRTFYDENSDEKWTIKKWIGTR